MIDKQVADLAAAVAGIKDGSTVLVGGFGAVGQPDELIDALLEDRCGNSTYRKSARNFNPVMAMAAELSIVQVEEIVELGAIDPECVPTPGIFIDRVVVV